MSDEDKKVGDIDFHLASLDDKDGNDCVLLLKTNNDRLVEDSDAMCAICYYNSENSEDEEQEKQILRKTLYDTGRYAQLCKTINTPKPEGKPEGKPEVNPEGKPPGDGVCSHRFHTVCLYKWIKSSREFKCPLCRATPLDDHTKMDNVPELFGSEPEYIVQYYPNGKVKSECYKENGLLDKFFKAYDLLGNITYECGYFKGDKHENEIEYHTHTTKKWKIQQYRFGSKHGYYKELSLEENSSNEQVQLKYQEWQNGMLHGKEQEWFLARQSKKKYCEYYEGLKHGTEKIWTISGKMIFFKKYDHGRPVGRCIVRFPDNGCLERKCYYNMHGQLDGIYMEWQYACTSLTKSNSKNEKKKGNANSAPAMGIIGMLTGGALNFGGNGDDEKEDEQDKYSTTDVILKIKCHYIDGIRVGIFKEYHDNGTLKILAHYNYDGDYDGEYFEYDRFGRCKLRYLYENGKLQGLCERYSDNGKVNECGYYNNDVLDGIGSYIQYYTNGRVKTKQSYNCGVMHGEYIYYTPKGEIAQKYIYNNNVLINN